MSEPSVRNQLSPSGAAGTYGTTTNEAHVLTSWIQQAAAVCEKAASGDLEQRLLHAPTDGDLGRLLRAINDLLDRTDAFVRESRVSLQYAAQGKFFRRVILRGMLGIFREASCAINNATEEMEHQAQRLKESDIQTKALAVELDQVIQSLASAATQVTATAKSLSETAHGTTDQALAARTATEQTSTNIENVSRAANEFRRESHAVDTTMRECVALASQAAAEAVEVGPVIQDLLAESNRVSGVVKLIAEIAGQTNLLALNATIEAVNAGEAGRGFAVVAAEVKQLARNTSSATNDIETEIERMQSAATKVSAALDKISQRIQGVDRIATAIAQSVDRQHNVADSIAENVVVAANAVREVSTSMQSLTDAARETHFSASQLLDAAGELSRQSEILHAHSGRYLQQITA